MHKIDFINLFPALTETNFEIVGYGPADSTTNCVGYVLELHGVWSPNGNDGQVWRDDIERNKPFRDHVDSYIRLFKFYGYAPCSELWADVSKHTTLEYGVEKIALYVRTEAVQSHDEFTHVVKQSPGGRWLSKIGTNEVIKHNLESLESRVDPPETASELRVLRFGKVALIMKRGPLSYRTHAFPCLPLRLPDISVKRHA